MPFKSLSQRRKFYQMKKEGKISSNVIKEFERETKGKRLPENVKSARKKSK